MRKSVFFISLVSLLLTSRGKTQSSTPASSVGDDSSNPGVPSIPQEPSSLPISISSSLVRTHKGLKYQLSGHATSTKIAFHCCFGRFFKTLFLFKRKWGKTFKRKRGIIAH